jgi:hypothetical protein
MEDTGIRRREKEKTKNGKGLGVDEKHKVWK